MDTIIAHKQIADFAPAMHETNEPKIIQFGTGVLLRGLVDYVINNANNNGLFNGSVVQIKSTKNGSAEAFFKQQNLYNVVVRGYKNKELVNKYELNSSIVDTIDANTNWHSVLQLAHLSSLEIIVSNTTETGISISPTDEASNAIPESYPAKLLALLYERYSYFNGSASKGYIIIPTELVSNNATYLKSLVLTLATRWNYDDAFINWVNNHNHFCNSLVDRIVTGKPTAEKIANHWNHLQYEDELLIECEPYLLWAIEGNEYVQQQLSFATPNSGVYVEPSIEKYKELKLRLLNGTHSFACAKAINSGFLYVRDAMNNADFRAWITHLIHQEIAVTLDYNQQEVTTFANSVLDRFSNPYIDHKWTDITLNYTQKMSFRNVENIVRYYAKFEQTPMYMAEGLAYFIHLMNPIQTNKNGTNFTINDPKAPEFATLFANYTPTEVIEKVLSNTDWWGRNLTELPNLLATVTAYYTTIKTSKP